MLILWQPHTITFATNHHRNPPIEMDRATPYFPPNYVTLKQLHDQRLKEKQDAEEADRLRRKLEEEEEEEQARKLDQQKEDEERLRTRRSTKPIPRPPRKHAAVIIAEGNPEDCEAVVEPKKGKKKNKKKKGKAARIEQNSLPENAGGEVAAVDGGEENAALAVRGGKGRGRNRRIEGSAGLYWRAVGGPGVGCGIKPNVMATLVQELRVERNGEVTADSVPISGGVVAVGEELKGNTVVGERGKRLVAGGGRGRPITRVLPIDRNVQVQAVAVAEDVAVTGDNGTCVDGKAVRGRPRRNGRRRVKAGPRPIDPSEPNQAVEVEVVENPTRNEDNETQEEGNVVEVEKGMKRMVGRGRRRNSGFPSSQGFSHLVTTGSHSSDGMVWVKKTVS